MISLPRIMRDLAVNIPILQYDENEIFSTVKNDDDQMHVFSKTIISEAHDKALTIVENAKKEAEHTSLKIREASLKKLEIEKQRVIEEAFEKAFAEGKEAGFAQGHSEAKKLCEEKNQAYEKEVFECFENALSKIENYKSEIKQDNKNLIVDLVLAISRKILDVKIQQDDQLLLNLINNALKQNEKCDTIKIKLGSKYFTTLQKYNDDLVNLLSQVTHQVVLEEKEDMHEDECLVETENTIIDLSMGVQLENAKSVIKSQLD